MIRDALEITWHDEESSGYVDVLPFDLFARVGTTKDVPHLVRGPRGGTDVARCSVRTGQLQADLDYAPYRAFNERHDMYLGVLRIRFADAARSRVIGVEWKYKGRPRFSTADVTWRRARPVRVDAPYTRGRRSAGRAPRDVTLRPGQGRFREIMLYVYGGCCCVTGCAVPAVLEAAHIDPFKGRHSDHPQNGLLLRRDLHSLFDGGLMAVHPKTRAVYFAQEAQAWPEYARVHGRKRLRSPSVGGSLASPCEGALESRWRVFARARWGDG